ncbi:MAG TPA: TetR/AcrR family transcriptional regulator [Candidatus Limnocylindrales bacterium]|nr:TetR/AcrR family transcriptional regulator [Candidatus Limnocylindrales bacterium]
MRGTMLDTRPRRRAIEDTASELFRERGYAATSVRDIAKALDIQGASLYAHVASKEDVLWAIVDRVATAFEAAVAGAEAGAGDRDPVDRLRAFVRAHVHVICADPGASSVFVHEWRHLSDDRRAAILERRDAYERRLRGRIADGIADGVFAMVDPALAATFLLTALNGIPTWYRREGHLSPDQLADAWADLAVRSLTEVPL